MKNIEKIKIIPKDEYEFMFYEEEVGGYFIELTVEELHLLSYNCAHFIQKDERWVYEKTKDEEICRQALENEYKDNLRNERQPLLEAWDILIGNVNFGSIIITSEEHENLIKWRKNVLELQEESIHNPPELVAQFLKKW